MNRFLFFALLPYALLADTPDVLWTTSPVLQNNTVLSFFTNVSGPSNVGDLHVELRDNKNGHIIRPSLLNFDNVSASFALPEEWPVDVYNYRICLKSGTCSQWKNINAANCIWAQGDRGALVTRGDKGTLRIFGRSLAYRDGQCQTSSKKQHVYGVSVRLSLHAPSITGSSRTERFTFVANKTVQGSCYDLSLRIPADVPLGKYSVEVKNNLPNSNFEACDTKRFIEVVDERVWPSTVFAVDDAPYFGNVSMALADAGSNGGGRVILEAGKTYEMGSDTVLFIPNGVTLASSGDGARQAMLRWAKAAPKLPQSPKFCTGPTRRKHPTDVTKSISSGS